MLGSLTLMASSLLLALAPVVGSSVATRDDANLPAIGYVMADDSRAGICPLGSENYQLENALNEVEINAYFSGSEAGIDLTSTDPYCSISYNDVDGLDIPGESPSSHYSTLIVVSVVFDTPSVDLYLPDLSYWTYEDGSYYLDVFVTSNADGLYSVYGNALTSGTLSYSLAELGEDVNPVGAIADGLGVIGALGGALGNGFDGVFMNGSALSAVGTFSFVLLGLGISVGIVKKCFNWVTGRHGM